MPLRRILILAFCLLTIAAEAQPGGYTEGTQVCWTFNGRGHGYFRAVGWNTATDHILIFFPGSGQTGCATYDGMQPGLLLRDGAGGSNWNGVTTLPAGLGGGTRRWMVFTMTNQENQPDVYAQDITHFFENAGVTIDLTEEGKKKIHYVYGSLGNGNANGFFNFGNITTNPYKSIHSTGIYMSTTLFTVSPNVPAKNMVWYGDADANGGTTPAFSVNIFNQLPGVPNTDKRLKVTVGGGHGNDTWGDCMRIDGTDSSTNRWIWMIQEGESLSSPPPPVGGYTPGQQVLKTFNSKNFLLFVPSDTTQRSTRKWHFIWNTVDSTGKDSAYATSKALAKKIRLGWPGYQKLQSGDTAFFIVATQIDGINQKNDMENMLQWCLDSLPNYMFDTSMRHRNIVTSIGLGAQNVLYYLTDRFGSIGQGGTLKFKDNFMNFSPIDMYDIGSFLGGSNAVGWSNMKQVSRTWWWYGSTNSYPYLPTYSISGEDSADNRNPFPNTMITPVIGQNFNQNTWDSAYSSLGTTMFNNMFIWWADSAYIFQDYPIANLIPVSTQDIYDLIQPVKQLHLLADGDENTVGINNFFEDYIFQQHGEKGVWWVLNRYINHPKIEVKNNNNGGIVVEFQLFYDWTDTTRHSEVFPVALPTESWKFLDTFFTRQYSDSVRLIKLTIHTSSAVGFSEVRIYGNDLGPAPSILPDPLPRPPDPLKWYQRYGKVFVDTLTDDAGFGFRIQNAMEWIDTATGANYNGGKKIWDNIFSNSTNGTYLPATRNGRKMHPYYANIRVNFMREPGNVQRKDIPVGADSSVYESYQDIYNTHYGMAAKFGFNTSADLTGYTFFNTNPGIGMGFFEEMEVGNEDMQHWNGAEKFHDVKSLLLKHKAGYNGIKAADPNMKVISGAFTGLRWDRWRAQYLTNLLMYKTKEYPNDIIAVNEYSTNAGGQHGANPPYDGITPEKFVAYEKLDSTMKLRDMYYPGKKVYITEIGYDATIYQDLLVPPYIDSIDHNSNYNVPDIAGQTREQTKAYWTMRWYEFGAATGVDAMFQYSQRDIGGGDFGSTGFSYNMNLRAPGQDILPPYMVDFVDPGRWVNGGCCVVLPKDLYWHMTMRANAVKNYYNRSIVIQNGDSTGIWVTRYIHTTSPDSVTYAIWYGTDNNTTGTFPLIISGGISGAKYMKGTPGSKTGNPTTMTVVDGNRVDVPVYEGVTYVAVKIPNQAGTKNTIRGNFRKNKFKNLDD